MSVKVTGFETLLNAIDEVKKLPEKAQKKALKGASMNVARQIRKEARKNAPVKSGILKAHIVALPSRSKEKNVIKAAVLVRRYKKITKEFQDKLKGGENIRTNKKQTKTDGFYARFVEHGTKHIQARNFLENALKKIEPKMADIAQESIDKFLKDDGWQ